MSINACNLNSYTIDAICGYRRGVIINNLLDKKYPPAAPIIGTNNQSLSRNFARTRPDLVRHVGEPVEPSWTFEVPQIIVTVEIAGERRSHSMFAADDSGTVLASNLNLIDAVEQITVNISDLKIDKK